MIRPKRVVIGVGGKWCAFDQALALLKCGFDVKIVTSFPSFSLKEENNDLPGRIISKPLPEVVYRVGSRLKFNRFGVPCASIKAALFDLLLSKYVKETDIFIGWAGFCSRSIKVAKNCGVFTILEKGSSHISWQREILFDEYKLRKITSDKYERWALDRELDEYENVDRVNVQSSFAFQSFLEKGVPRDKLTMNPLGVNLNIFKKQSKSIFDKKQGNFNVLFVGSVSLRKGIPYLVEAVKKLRRHDSSIVLRLAGGMMDETKEWMNIPGVDVLGYIPRKNLPLVYSSADVLVLPSLEDGFGLVLIEAMACGIPIITTTNTAGPDLIRDRIEGIIVPPRDIDALADAIQWLKDNPKMRTDMGIKARERVNENFTWKNWADRFKEIMEKI